MSTHSEHMPVPNTLRDNSHAGAAHRAVPVSSGQPIPAQDRDHLESHFGADFSDVRISTDSEADQLTSHAGARAYAAGNHIVFGSGQYSPMTAGGRHLLAHELAHVMQQRRSTSGTAGGSSGSSLEREADRAAELLGRAASPVTISGAPNRIDRQPSTKPGSPEWMASQHIPLKKSVETTHWESPVKREDFIRRYLAFAKSNPALAQEYSEGAAAFPEYDGTAKHSDGQKGEATPKPPGQTTAKPTGAFALPELTENEASVLGLTSLKESGFRNPYAQTLAAQGKTHLAAIWEAGFVCSGCHLTHFQEGTNDQIDLTVFAWQVHVVRYAQLAQTLLELGVGSVGVISAAAGGGKSQGPPPPTKSGASGGQPSKAAGAATGQLPPGSTVRTRFTKGRVSAVEIIEPAADGQRTADTPKQPASSGSGASAKQSGASAQGTQTTQQASPQKSAQTALPSVTPGAEKLPIRGPFVSTMGSGTIKVGDQVFVIGDLVKASPSAKLLGETSTVAKGTVTVGNQSIANAEVVAGGSVLPVGPEKVGRPLTAAIVAADRTYYVVTPAPGTNQPAEAPGKDSSPAHAPGTEGSPAAAPGHESGKQPASDPAEKAPAEAPGAVVDDPAECAKLIGSKTRHDHHIMPQKFRSLFAALGIDIDEYTITMRWDEHIGSKGVHNAMEWNPQWQDFFDEMPNPVKMTARQALEWQRRAIAYAIKLMGDAGMDPNKVHPWGKPRTASKPVPKLPGK